MKGVRSIAKYSLILSTIVLISSCSSITIHPLSKSKNNKSNRTQRQYTHVSKRTKTKRVAKIASPPATSQLRSQIVDHAMRHIGTKYVYGGKHPGGFDCSGFTAYVLNRQGLPVAGSSRDQARIGKKKPKAKLAPGDLAFFGSRGKVTHVGIVKENTGDQLIVVHSTSSKGVRTDDINGSDYWKSRFLFGRDVID